MELETEKVMQMKSTIFDSLSALAKMPNKDTENWLQSAEEGVQFLKHTCESNKEIFLYASGPHCHMESILVLRDRVTPPNHADLAAAHLMIDDTWLIQRSCSGKKDHRIYLEPPLSFAGCQTLEGGEKLVFRRNFEGVKNYQPELELNQKLVHSLELYYMDESSAYCRLDRHGDLEKIITVFDDKNSDHLQRTCAITIRGRDLAKYMALSSTAFVTKFDFTRFRSGSFYGWGETERKVFQSKDLYYQYGVMPNHASYANGHIVLHAKLTEDDLIEEWKAEEDSRNMQYTSFKILDRKNKKLVETSCGPEYIVNYFTKSDLPWEISPAFFRPEVLLKYKNDPEKYTIKDRSINCREAWHLETYDINEAGQVHTYIGYLAKLPFEEQLYWQSFNEWPKDGISKRAFQTDILGEFSTEDDPLAELKGIIKSLDRDAPSWWNPRGEVLIEEVLHPATDTIEEWGNEILALYQLVVEGFRVKGLRSIIGDHEGTYEKRWGSLKLIEVMLSRLGRTEEEARNLVQPLKELNSLRISAKAHGNPAGRQAAVVNARKSHGNLREHFQNLVGSIRDSIKKIVSILSKNP